MENKFQTSFIPKKSLEDTGKVRVKSPVNILSLVSTIVIVAVLLGAGAVYGYSALLSKRTSSSREALVKKEKDFNYGQVEAIVRVDNKLRASKEVLESHTAASRVFSFLEESTLKNLRFNSFEFTYLSPKRISVSMKGQARTFGAVAKQAELFASSSPKGNFSEPVFSDLNVDGDGQVTFSFLSSVDPTLISYEESI